MLYEVITGFAGAVGVKVHLIGVALVTVTAIAAVAAFDAVGSIIVIAMFICPPAAARLMTNRLPHRITSYNVCYTKLLRISAR